uniref:Putative secreted protein n=1 Tax=Ixodes ricinus TaxID=34613 RepID=A0A6B0UBN6_IXORI
MLTITSVAALFLFVRPALLCGCMHAGVAVRGCLSILVDVFQLPGCGFRRERQVIRRVERQLVFGEQPLLYRLAANSTHKTITEHHIERQLFVPELTVAR